jgi:hypothetical protein
MAVLRTLRAPARCRHVHCELLRSALLDVTPIIPVTACHQRNDVERYSRFNETVEKVRSWHFHRKATLENKGVIGTDFFGFGDRPLHAARVPTVSAWTLRGNVTFPTRHPASNGARR